MLPGLLPNVGAFPTGGEIGNAAYWSAGSFKWPVPPLFRVLRVRIVGAGGGGYLFIFGGGGQGTAGGPSSVPELGIGAGGGGGYGAGGPGTGYGGEFNNQGTPGQDEAPGTPVPLVGTAGYGGRHGPGTQSKGYGHGAGYAEGYFYAGMPALEPGKQLTINIGSPGHSSGYAGNTIYWGNPGACLLDWW